jgi:hypothetical protein
LRASSQPHSHPNGSPRIPCCTGPAISLMTPHCFAHDNGRLGRHCQGLIARGSTASREHPMIALHVKPSSPRHVARWYFVRHITHRHAHSRLPLMARDAA